VLLEKGVIERMEAAGTQAGGMSQPDFVEYLKKEEALWLPVIKAANIKAD
jgi:tripartite-type tricarboxylate transporter receptor subunit TctC